MVMSTIITMFVHNFIVYSWSVSLIKELEMNIKNFLWSRDMDKTKLVTMAWKRVCKTINQSGLGLRSLLDLNEASNLKLCWDVMHSKEDWAITLKCRSLRNDAPILYHIYSSIWSNIKK